MAVPINPQDPNNLRGSYGAADYDVRHSINANYVWELPIKEALRGHGPDYLGEGMADFGNDHRPDGVSIHGH